MPHIITAGLIVWGISRGLYFADSHISQLSTLCKKWLAIRQWPHRSILVQIIAALGHELGLLNQLPPFRYLINFSPLLKHWLPNEYHVYIWLALLQLSSGKWFKDHINYQGFFFAKSKNVLRDEVNERSFSNPCPGMIAQTVHSPKPSNMQVVILHTKELLLNWLF